MPGEAAGAGAGAGGSSMGMFLPALGISGGMTVLGAVMSGIADRQAMRAMMGAKQKQLALWQSKRNLDMQAQTADIERQNEEMGGLKSQQVLGDQNAANAVAGTNQVTQALAAEGAPVKGSTADLSASLLPALLQHAQATAPGQAATMEQGNEGPYQLGQQLRDTNWNLTSALFPGMDSRAAMKGMGLRFGSQLLGLGGGLGAALSPYMSRGNAGSVTKGRPSPTGDYNANPNPNQA